MDWAIFIIALLVTLVGTLTAMWREAELLVSSLRNAAANEQRRAAKMTKPNEHND